MRLSLLRNKGAGVFEDVTLACGLGEPIQTEAAAWGDYDNDGRLDLFVCGEYLLRQPDRRPTPPAEPLPALSQPRATARSRRRREGRRVEREVGQGCRLGRL